MAIKIIKQGKMTKFTKVCPDCGCEFEYEQDDIKVDYSCCLTTYPCQYGTYVICPCCGKHLHHGYMTAINYPNVTYIMNETWSKDCDKCPNKPDPNKNDNQDIKKQKFDIVEKDLDLLEEYRKIEEEIGVDFITLVKMLKDDVYINDGGIVDEIGNIYEAEIKCIEHWPVWGFTVDGVDYAFKDRGKTWALDKEEFYETLSK